MPQSEEIVKKIKKFPVLLGILPIKRSQVPLDSIAGISLAALAIPEVMGYAKIAGMPIVSGLYTLLIPLALFAIFGSSRHLVVGADSATAAILATALVTMALPGSSQYSALAGMVALLAAGFLILSRIFKLGFIADFLSRSVLIGFLTGVGIQVALSQIPGMFGVPNEVQNPILQLAHMVATEIPQMNGITIILSILVLVIIMGGNRVMKKLPWAFLVVIGTIVTSWALNLTSLGVATIGTVPGGFPLIAFPAVPLDQVPNLLGVAAACFIVILAQSAATSRAYAVRYEEKFDENVDLVGLSLSNLAAGLSGSFVINGSPTKTEMVDNAGGRSQLAQIVTAGVVLIVLLFVTAPLSYLPSAVLASIVFTIGVNLIDLNGLRNLLYRRPVEFMVALITALTVIFISVGWGIALAVVLSIIAHLRHSYRPLNFLLVESPDRGWALTSIQSRRQAAPGLAVYHFGANLYYANEARFTSDILEIVKNASPSLRWLCLSASSIQDIDYSGSEALKQLHGELKKRGIVLVLSSVEDQVMHQLERDNLIDLIGKEHIFEFTRDMIVAYQKLPERS
ncbi:SulP family inorganic anion transporter [Methanosphaerula palustris]|uniref:Sulphate transporter n=1 Tax=Methanosphaerula palustris (strain ATCC BAA-1556 / DSM 19958 / E1-9c) TaxID=521011 RepID=B8GI19_METPE|nr:SulP family inorganic anion transporter [Methanosphaerula palustris]ACL16759.1 sulphate transporter [Methanosphaerula palustris E1-9c]